MCRIVRLVRALHETSDLLQWVWRHPANRRGRVRAIGRAFSHQVRGRVLKRPTIAKIGNHARIEVDLHATGASKAVYANPPDWPEMLVWSHRLRQGDLFIDVGANAGVYSLFAADLGADVVAIEPGSEASNRLRRNLALNDLPIVLIEAALTDHEGTVGFDSSGGSLGHIGGEEVVVATTLDRVLGSRRAAGVKIDVEGFERLVLQGASEALREHRLDCVQLEWNECSKAVLDESRHAAGDLLATFGYLLYRPTDEGRLQPISDYGYGPDVFALPS
jgi:FkbM family methyltransferase